MSLSTPYNVTLNLTTAYDNTPYHYEPRVCHFQFDDYNMLLCVLCVCRYASFRRTMEFIRQFLQITLLSQIVQRQCEHLFMNLLISCQTIHSLLKNKRHYHCNFWTYSTKVHTVSRLWLYLMVAWTYLRGVIHLKNSPEIHYNIKYSCRSKHVVHSYTFIWAYRIILHYY